MAPPSKTRAKRSSQDNDGKVKSGKKGGPKKLTAFNKFMKTEMARLKETMPDMEHRERFKLATSHWKNAKENPKRVESEDKDK